MAATDAQVQSFFDQRIRPRCEQIRDLYLLCKDDKSVIADVYEHLNGSPTWDDDRPDAPPHLMTPANGLAWNAFITGFIALVEGTFADVGEANSVAANYPTILNGCVNPPL